MKKALSRTSQNGNDTIRCLDASILDRPLDLTRKMKARMIPLVLVAVIIGAAALFFILDSVLNANAREEAAIEEVLANEAPLALPNLASLVTQSDADILAVLRADGDTIYELSNTANGEPLNIVRLPSDLTAEQAAAYYLKGVKNLSAPELVKLLYGSWTLETSHESGANIGLHYVDFDAFDEKTAVQRAMDAEGYTADMTRESGTDDSGNTFATGDITIGDGLYSWRVSCLPASDMYSQGNLPKSYYVGIRIYN